MSLDNIRLSPIAIQAIYKNNLIAEKKTKTPSKPDKAAISLTILGNNKQKILILIKNDEALYLPDDELTFLTGILAACKLTLEDVAILNTHKNKNISFVSITKELQAQKVLLFGVTATDIQLPVEFPLYSIESYNEQAYLAAPELSIVQNDKIEKTRLWLSLKQLFSII
ncbi:MAG: hypothetical protein HY305_07525 [Sphingobacteriales bacterium]|nr:hypothetical protein [Sphingobacteriales bacterium]